MDIYEINSELVLLDLFGFKLTKISMNNKFNILDEFNQTIGFIEKKVIKTIDGNPIFNIYIEFTTEDILYKNSREININSSNKYNDNSYTYTIAKRNNDGSLNYVYLNLGNTKEISFSHNHHLAIFKIKNNELILNIKGNTENFNYEEKLAIISSNKPFSNKSYKYTISFCDKSNDLNNERTKTILSLTAHELYHYFSCSKGEIFEPCFKLNLRKIVNGKMIDNNYFEIPNCQIKDLIINHNDTLEMFSHFKYLANNILPFKKEIISYAFETENLTDEFLVFVSNDSRKYLKTFRQ